MGSPDFSSARPPPTAASGDTLQDGGAAGGAALPPVAHGGQRLDAALYQLRRAGACSPPPARRDSRRGRRCGSPGWCARRCPGSGRRCGRGSPPGPRTRRPCPRRRRAGRTGSGARNASSITRYLHHGVVEQVAATGSRSRRAPSSAGRRRGSPRGRRRARGSRFSAMVRAGARSCTSPCSLPAPCSSRITRRHAAGAIEALAQEAPGRLAVDQQRDRRARCAPSPRSSSSTPMWRAMAIMCGGQLVEAPSAEAATMVFSKASRVMMSDGRRFSCTISTMRLPVT